MVASGCSGPTQPAAATVQKPAQSSVNTAPLVKAGPDIWVASPDDSVVLEGSAEDAANSIGRLLWTKTSGPPSYSIETPGLARTRVMGLEQGTYEFRLAVTDKGGLTGVDTLKVHVHTPSIPGANEVVFRDLRWICPMGCSVTIENFGSYVPEGAAVKVFRRTPEAGVWFELKPEAQWLPGRYVYAVRNDRLTIGSDDEIQGTVLDVKIVR